MEATLEALRRDQFGKNNAGRLRREGKIPAVLYGGTSTTAESVSVDPKELMRILRSQGGANTLIALKLDGVGDTRVLLKTYQIHPVSHKLLHADFFRVAMDQLVRVTVPVHLVGDAKGVKAQGAVVDFVHRELVVECLPADIPGGINVDITELMMHDGIRVREIETGGKWKALSEPDLLIVHLIAPKTEAEPATADAVAAATATAEPEVIKKGKIEKDEDKE
jgi:large subunit ribosomal protein L25